MNFRRFVQRRARGDRFLALGVLIAVFLAATVMAGGPIYLRSLERIGMAEMVGNLGIHNRNIIARSDWTPLEVKGIADADAAVDAAIDSDLAPLITHGSTRIKTRPHFWVKDDGDPETRPEVVRGELASRLFFHELEGLFSAIHYVEGRAPTAQLRTDENGDQIVEVAIYVARAGELRHGLKFETISVGDTVVASSVSRKSGFVNGEIVGIFEANDRSEEFWIGNSSGILEPMPPELFGGRDLPVIFFTAEGAIAAGVGPSNAGLPMNYSRVLFTDSEKIALQKADVVISAMDHFETEVQTNIPRGIAHMGPRSSTNRMAQKMLFLQLPALLLAALSVAVVGYYLFLVSGLIARKRELETVMLRSRGLSNFQVMRVQVIEAAVTVGVPAAVAPILAFAFTGFAGRLPVFESLTHGQNLPVELTPMAWGWAAGAAFISFLIVLLPTLLVARSGISKTDQSRARPDSPPIFQRLYFDLLIIVLGGLFLWEITKRGVATTDREGEVVTDPTLLFAPAMLLISVALVMLRAFPIITKTSSWIATRFTSAPMAVGLWRLRRSPYWYAWPVLLITLGTGLGVMVGTLGSTLERSSREQIFYENGTSMRIRPGGVISEIRQSDIDNLLAIDGVNSATMAFRQIAEVGTTSLGMAFNVLGVEVDTVGDMLWFREDFSEQPIGTLFESMDIPSRPEPLILPEGTTSISAWAKQDPYVMDHFFWVVLKDAKDRQITVTLGQISDTWSSQSGLVPQHLTDPIEITSLQTFMQASGDSGAPTTWLIDDLNAIGPNFEITLLDFEGDSLWTPLATSNGLDVEFTDAPEPADVGIPGSGIGRIQLERGTVSGVRGIYQSSTGEPMPVIVSESFAALTGTVVGEPTVVQIGGGFVPVIPIGITELFPTLDPSVRPFMVVDVKTLLEFIELRGLVNMNPNEAFLDIDQENHAEITQEIRRLFRSSVLLDREARVEDSVIDPLTVAGWRGMGVVSLIIGGLALVLGYVTYLVAHSNRTIHDSAYLRAMGLSKPGFMRSALIEHGMVAIVGVGVGVAAGLFSSRVAVGAIAHSDRGRALLPPFILETSWWPLIFVLTVAAAAGFVGVVSAFIGFLRKPLHELTRSAE